MLDPTQSGKYAVPTYRNTEFLDWWRALNAELAKLNTFEVGFKDARDCYDMGESPDTAAANLWAVREAEKRP